MGYPFKKIPLVNRIEKYMKAGDEKKPGFVCAQVFEDEVKVFFIPHEKALKFQELMDQRVGSTTTEMRIT